MHASDNEGNSLSLALVLKGVNTPQQMPLARVASDWFRMAADSPRQSLGQSALNVFPKHHMQSAGFGMG